MRAREAYRARGPDELGDVELVALLLGTGLPGRSAAQIAADVLGRFGGLRGVAKAEPAALQAIPGVGLARAVRLHAALEAGRRSSIDAPAAGISVRTAEAAARWLGPPLQLVEVEEFHALYLDRLSRPIAHRCLTRGSDGFTVVDCRQVFRPAVALGAVATIVAHNHPSGDPTPSGPDRDVTRRLVRAGEVLGIRLLDHLVFGQGGSWQSMAELGMVPRDSEWEPLGLNAPPTSYRGTQALAQAFEALPAQLAGAAFGDAEHGTDLFQGQAVQVVEEDRSFLPLRKPL
jgi:DNA repair protein RadC